jgi:hypothetical protein
MTRNLGIVSSVRISALRVTSWTRTVAIVPLTLQLLHFAVQLFP